MGGFSQINKKSSKKPKIFPQFFKKKHDKEESTVTEEVDVYNPPPTIEQQYIDSAGSQISSGSNNDKKNLNSDFKSASPPGNPLFLPPPPSQFIDNVPINPVPDTISLAETGSRRKSTMRAAILRHSMAPGQTQNLIRPINPIPIKQKQPEPQKKVVQVIDDQVECSQSNVIFSFQRAFSDRLSINLPLDELNAASLRADVLLSMVKDKTENLDKSLSGTESKMEEVSYQMEVIIAKTHSITQTSAVINSKLKHMDEWIESIDTNTSNLKLQITEFFVSVFSLLTVIFSLMWFSFRRESKMRRRNGSE